VVPAAPALGRAVVVSVAQGSVFIKTAGASRFRVLGANQQIPTGSVIDARRGRVRLTSALDTTGRRQTGEFWGAFFKVHQSRAGKGMTELELRGGDFSRCRPVTRTKAQTSAKRRDKVIRSLWGRDRNGRFRTRGRESVATVRGTEWLTEDRCDGTLTVVRSGAVTVRALRSGVKRLVTKRFAYFVPSTRG